MDNMQPAQGSPLSGQVLFYSNPQPLSAEQHAGLGLKQVEKPFAFLGKAHAVPLTVNEFGLASTSFPIIFVGEDKTPIGAMGIRQEENLFVTAEGTVDPDFYIPAFARRYPFVFANDQPTEFTNNAMQFCQEFERQRRNTMNFVGELTRLDLFTQKTASIQPRDPQGNSTGEPQKVADYWAIDEQKLNELPAEKLAEMNQNGMLGACYAHIISLNNWSRVINRAVRAQGSGAPQEPQGGASGPGGLQI